MLSEQPQCKLADQDLPIKREPGRELRQWERRNLNLRCSVTCKGETVRAQLLNISVGGALISGVDRFPRGVPVLIEIDTGKTLQAIVAWATAGRTGIKFDVPLPATDTLLTSE